MFVNDIIRAVVLLWPGHAAFVNGNPGHSQSQGMVEQGNNTIQTMRTLVVGQDGYRRFNVSGFMIRIFTFNFRQLYSNNNSTAPYFSTSQLGRIFQPIVGC